MTRPVLLQVAGLLIAAVGVGLIYIPAGVIVGGAALFAIGLARDQVRR